jgi:hypothetical protein
MIEFILGIWTPLSTTSIPASLSTASNKPGNLPSRSRIKNRAGTGILKIHDEVLVSLGDPGGKRISLGTEELSPGGSGALGCRVDPGLAEDLPHGGGGDPDPEDKELTVDAAVAPAGILPCQAQDQLADGADGARPARTLGAGPGRMAACQQVAVPAQHRVRPHQQPNRPRTSRGSQCSRAARNARSLGQNRGRVFPG